MESSPTLEGQLMEAGNKLLKPPSSVKELLPLLDEAVSFLTKVQQSPAKSVLASLSPLIKALVEDALLRISNPDVKVSLASCISEITRITAPSVPYGDEKMRSVFELIVSSFENLCDDTSRSFKNRAMILKTVCKVRLWVLMLDLKCDELISRMFRYFIKSIREYHPYYMFSSMESIMTAVLEESDDISVDLVTSLLASVRKENKEINAIGRRLAACVLRNCAFRLKPYVKCAIKSLSLSLDEYHRYVTSVMQGAPIFLEHNNDTSNDPLSTEKKFASSGFGKMVQALGNKAHTVTSDVLCQRSEDANQEDPPVNNELEAEKTPGSQVSKRDGHCSLAKYSTEEQKAKGEGITNFPTDDTPVEAAKHLEENGSGGQLFLHKTPENESATVSLSDLSYTVHDSLVQMTIQPKEDDSLVQNKKEPLSAAIASKMPCEETYDLISRDPGTNVQADTSLEEESWSMRDAKVKGLKEQGEKTKANEKNGVSSRKTSDSESLPQNPSTREQRESSLEGKAGSICDAVAEGPKQQVGKTQSQRGRVSTEIDVSESSEKDENNRLLFSEIPSMKSAGGVCNDGNQSRSTKRKHTLDKEKLPENPIITYYESLVGSNVQVYMPGDDIYYNGVIKSFDRVKKKHTVWYTHGEEVLDLKEEVWNIVSESLTERKALDQLYSWVVCDAGSKQIKADKREGVSLKTNGEPKSGQHGKASTEIDLSKSSTKDDNRLLLSEEHHMKDAEDDGKGNNRKNTKRKHSLGREKVLKNQMIAYDESLVGSNIQVYWPLNGVYYDGVIKYFDPVKKMHTVLYNDGEVEVLDLKYEKWHIVSEMQRHRIKESGGLAETSSKHDGWDVSSHRSTEIDLSNSSTKDDNDRLLLCDECRMKAAEDDRIEGNKRKIKKRKHYLGKEKVLKKRKIKYDESLVGSKIQVRWPLDDKYYDGVIEDFNHLDKTHKVVYIDGEIENLRLNEEEWRIVSEKQREKKKTSGELVETSSKHGKLGVSSQSNGSHSLGASPTHNGKFKDDTDDDPKSKDHPSQSGSTDYKDMTDNCPTCHFNDGGSGILKGMFCSSSKSKSSKSDASPKTATELQQDTIITKAVSQSNGKANGGTSK